MFELFKNIFKFKPCFLLIIYFTHFTMFNFAKAASCCGSNLSAPMLITTNEKIKMQMSYIYSKKIFQALNKEQIILLDDPKSNTQFNVKAGYLFENDIQIGTQLTKNEMGGVGDTLMSMGKEFAPIGQLRNYFWSSLSLPTGLSIEQVPPSTSPTGSGVPLLLVGAMVTEILPRGDLAITVQFGQGFANKLTSINSERISMMPSHQWSLSCSGGLSSGPWRLGTSYQYQWLSGRKIENQSPGLTSYQSTVSLQVSYLIGSQIWSLSYNDDSLVGPAQNAFLNRGMTFSFIERWFD